MGNFNSTNMTDISDGYEMHKLRFAFLSAAMRDYHITCTHYFRFCECCLNRWHKPGDFDCGEPINSTTCVNPRFKIHPGFEFSKHRGQYCDQCLKDCGEGRLVGKCSKKKITIQFLDRFYKVRKDNFLSLLKFNKDGTCNCCFKPNSEAAFCKYCDVECVDKPCRRTRRPIGLDLSKVEPRKERNQFVSDAFLCKLCDTLAFGTEFECAEHLKSTHGISLNNGEPTILL